MHTRVARKAAVDAADVAASMELTVRASVLSTWFARVFVVSMLAFEAANLATILVFTMAANPLAAALFANVLVLAMAANVFTTAFFAKALVFAMNANAFAAAVFAHVLPLSMLALLAGSTRLLRRISNHFGKHRSDYKQLSSRMFVAFRKCCMHLVCLPSVPFTHL